MQGWEPKQGGWVGGSPLAELKIQKKRFMFSTIDIRHIFQVFNNL